MEPWVKRDLSVAIFRWKSTVAVTLQLDCETFMCVIWGFKNNFILFMTCHTGQVFCSVESVVGVRIGLSCADLHVNRQDTRWWARPRPSTDSLQCISEEMCIVTCCQSSRNIRNVFELNWELIEWLFFGLNQTYIFHWTLVCLHVRLHSVNCQPFVLKATVCGVITFAPHSLESRTGPVPQ